MRPLILILLTIILFLLVIAAILAGAVGIAYVLRWVWPAIDPGSATIVSLIALLVTLYLAWQLISLAPIKATGIDDDEEDNDEDDEEEARRTRRAIWRIQPDTEVYRPKRRRRKRRG